MLGPSWAQKRMGSFVRVVVQAPANHTTYIRS